jgi:hypothetical protein
MDGAGADAGAAADAEDANAAGTVGAGDTGDWGCAYDCALDSAFGT